MAVSGLTRRALLRGSAVAVAAVAVGGAGVSMAYAADDAPVSLPAATGPYAVGTRTIHLTDDHRSDPFAPEGTSPPRELMIQVWYAAGSTYGLRRAPYLSAGLVPVVEKRFTLPEGALARVRTESWLNAPVHHELRDAPVVFFGPGRQDPAATGTAFAQDLASHGYLVIGVNHTYDGPVEFPDGRVVPQNPGTGDVALLRKYSDVRAADLSFVLDVLAGERGATPLGRFTPPADLGRVGVFGHSLGGSAAAEVVRTDGRFAVGACLDGALQTDAVQTGLDRPFLLFTEPLELPTWSDFMAHHTAWGRRMILAGARHYSFTDLAPLGVSLGLAQVWSAEQFAKYFGAVDGVRSQAVTAAYVRAYFAHRLRGEASVSPSLDGVDADFPEVAVSWVSGG
ncbi:alpha/beta hydrolase [Streptomyces sp. NBC_01304]|uniref:alpha/beta hydrolase n=1 Tax=Streptomyces sp. NBC_01304 TaxID=2903818 RepID=UPI002E0E2267|nr:alpha/beta hydrolase [Streptomyces sp. NBC_01304]